MFEDRVITFRGKISDDDSGFDLAGPPRVIWIGRFEGQTKIPNSGIVRGEHQYRLVARSYGSIQTQPDRLRARIAFEKREPDAMGEAGWNPLDADDEMQPDDLILAALGDLSMGEARGAE